MAEKRILIVEDEPAIAEVLEYNLAKEDYEVGIEYRGDTALETIRQNPPDLVILDLMLPGLGPAIVKHVAQLHGGRVEVESHLGQGSTFRVYLPVGPS